MAEEFPTTVKCNLMAFLIDVIFKISDLSFDTSNIKYKVEREGWFGDQLLEYTASCTVVLKENVYGNVDILCKKYMKGGVGFKYQYLMYIKKLSGVFHSLYSLDTDDEKFIKDKEYRVLYRIFNSKGREVSGSIVFDNQYKDKFLNVTI